MEFHISWNTVGTTGSQLECSPPIPHAESPPGYKRQRSPYSPLLLRASAADDIEGLWELPNDTISLRKREATFPQAAPWRIAQADWLSLTELCRPTVSPKLDPVCLTCVHDRVSSTLPLKPEYVMSPKCQSIKWYNSRQNALTFWTGNFRGTWHGSVGKGICCQAWALGPSWWKERTDFYKFFLWPPHKHGCRQGYTCPQVHMNQ